ncbi:glycosyltransferase family 4 protein [Azoarcus sp. KH32C]|uniref:glycosyltransferase family 4 protein n=1 Tax=Azoarcus sp. KH32C TaxID=748247 RepID=UPI00023866AD|nr:glycosyltransferase family 4 protein [Azoarcus sp. KH32C]BAL22590.1 glycosyltransferase family protein [Azoarcus sp. KH32C]
MKVLIVNNMAPFVWGGAEELAAHLEKNLIIAGHDAEVMRIPFQWEPANGIPAQMLMVRAFELWNVDRVIALKFPAYLIRHPHKTLWLLHQYRQAYDLFDAGQSNIGRDVAGDELRTLIRNADNECFAETRRIFTNSGVTQQRLKHYNGFDAEVLLPPLNDADLFTGGQPQGYVFAGGRVNGMKRQHLLIEALARTKHPVRLVVAGPPDTPADAQRLHRLVEELGLQDRVHLALRFLDRSELARYVNEASACAYLPYDEDSLGYVAMEAATAGKPILTTNDSGGVLGLVHDRETGWVCEPSADSLATALEAACSGAANIEAMGLAARKLWLDMEITWPATIERLLG